ncbi:unnamed protein product [Cuscuta epithymum]|uniref:Uncharacterized protein n=1 Tax=Cuscuta epithymum TaxID=186058 RepID=A0AAV0CV91_9ASTE|nr:unnamed protein product [Cuscuta epithymum]
MDRDSWHEASHSETPPESETDKPWRSGAAQISRSSITAALKAIKTLSTTTLTINSTENATFTAPPTSSSASARWSSRTATFSCGTPRRETPTPSPPTAAVTTAKTESAAEHASTSAQSRRRRT